MQNLAMLNYLPEVQVGHELFGDADADTDENSGSFNTRRMLNAAIDDRVDVTDLAREIGFQRMTVVVTRAVHLDCQQRHSDAFAPVDEARDGPLIALLFRAAVALRQQYRPAHEVIFTMHAVCKGSVKRVAYRITADAGRRGESLVMIQFADEHGSH